MEWHFVYIYIITAATAIYLFLKWKFNYWQNRGVPVLPSSMPFGHMKGIGKEFHFKDVFHKAYFEFKHKSPITGLYLSINPVACVTDLDLAKNILIKDFNNFIDRPGYYNEKDDPLTAHMFNLQGDRWRAIRTKLSPTFTSGKMKFMFSTVVNVADRFIEALEKTLSSDGVIEMKEFLSRFTTDVIGECAFGIECNSLKDPNAEFRSMGRKIFAEPRHSIMMMLMILQFPNVARRLHIKFERDDVSEFFLGIIRETVAYREKNNVRRHDFMDLLLELKNSEKKLTVEEIAAQAFLFFEAGFETSSTTLSFALSELAVNQEAQDKARAEVIDVLARHKGQLTYEAMTEMRYIDQIITETLRMHPPVVNLFRTAKEDYPIPDTNIVIEKGIPVFIPISAIQRDPEFFQDPNAFRPERFDPDEVKDRHPMTFLSFGEGPRNCIGLRFGRMQSRIGLINLLRNFKINRCSKTIVPLKYNNASGILASEGGLYVQLEKI